MNFITKQTVLKINSLLFIILFFLLFSCSTKEPNEMIELIEVSLNDNIKHLEYINEWIDKQSYSYPYFLKVNRSEALAEIHYNDGFYYIEDDIFAYYLTSFLYSTDFLRINVYKDVILYDHNMRNSEFNEFSLIYLKNKNIKQLQKYKFHETGNIPNKISGWIYHLQGNWYLMSPFPEKE